jgi:adenylate cyclase
MTPPAGTPQQAAAIVAAERAAMRLAALLRCAVALGLLGVFLLVHPRALMPHHMLLVVLGLGAYVAVGLATLAIAARGRLQPWMGLPLAVLDLAVYATVLVGTARMIGIPLAAVVALPPFLVIYLLLAVGTLRYIATTVTVTTAGVAAAGLLLLAWPGAAGGTAIDPRIAGLLFGNHANTLRLAMIVATGMVLALVVRRARETLASAVAEAERSANLSRYLPRPVAELVATQGIGALSRGRRQSAAVLFADIVGFTALAERMPPEQVGRLLTEVRTLQRRAIEDTGGIVDKFIGDAVMAVFGIPEPDPAAPRRALAAAAALQERLAAWNSARVAVGEPPIEVGAGPIVTAALLEASGADLAAWQPIPASTVRGRLGTLKLYRPAAADERQA